MKLLLLHEKQTYMFICYRFQTFCNMKKNIVVSLVAAIIFFCLKIISKFILLFHEKRRDVYFSYLFFQIATPYILYIFLFQQCKKTSRSAVSNFIQNCVAWKHSLPGTLIIAFVVGLDPDDEIFR